MGALHDALIAEREGRFLDAFGLAHTALAQAPNDPDTLNVLGRMCYLGGDLTSAIGLQQHALRLAPQHPRAVHDLDAALAAIPSPKEGRDALLAAYARAPDIAVHHQAPGSLPPLAAFDEVHALIERAIHLNPSLAQAHAALGNLYVRSGRYEAALLAYRRGLLLEPDDAHMHLALAEIAYESGDEASAQGHRVAALARRRLFSTPVQATSATASVLVLAFPGAWSRNVCLDFMLDPARTIVHRLYLTDERFDSACPLPTYDVVFNAIGEAQAAQPFIAAAGRFIAAQGKPALNLPEHLAKTARPALAGALSGVAGCTLPKTVRRERAALGDLSGSMHAIGGIAFPLLIRPADAHGGDGLERLGDVDQIGDYLARNPSERFDLSAFVDYSDPDGFYRKYRVIFVDGTPYPYHLAIAPEWMVHYRTSPMAEHAWMRDEEARFLAGPHALFPHWDRTFGAVAAAIGLEYFGIDCARTQDGGVLIFEADAATWIHNRDRSGLFAYKARYVERIFSAVEAMFARRAGG